MGDGFTVGLGEGLGATVGLGVVVGLGLAVGDGADVGFALTVIRQFAVNPPSLLLTVIVAVQGAIALTVPLLTVATEVFVLDHSTVFIPASLGVNTGVSVLVVLTASSRSV